MKKKKKVLDINESGSPLTKVRALASALVGRASIMSKLGEQYQGSRDIYKTLGYVKNPTFQDYWNKYQRDGVARRVIKAPVSATWRKKPEISESDKEQGAEDSKFEIAWKGLVKQRKIYHYLTRADELAGVGKFGAILMGFNDGAELTFPLNPGESRELLYLKPYREDSIAIDSWEKDPKNERYGLPLIYKFTTKGVESIGSQEIKVHYTRVLHVAEGCIDDEINGTPRLKCVLNYLMDLEKVAGGSGEMFWRGAAPRFAAIADPEYDFDSISQSEMEEEIEKMMHDLKSYVKLKGVDIKTITSQIASPQGHADLLISLISSGTGIPQRILLGSERGELASSQDEKNWNSRIDERRVDHIELTVLRPFVDKMIWSGVIPEPDSGEFSIIWPDISVPDEKDRAEMNNKRSDTLSKYASVPDAQMIVPSKMFMKLFLEMEDEEIQAAEAEFEEMQREIQRQTEEDERIIEEDE